ncbi:MAG: hypothetical protein Cons2KO_04290 [Congregibacter sp.]
MKALLVTVFLLPLVAQAQSLGMQSDWLELVKGHRDGITGAQVMDVSNEPETGYQKVMVKIPKASMNDDSDMEEVKVIGKAPENKEMPDLLPELETEWVDDYDNDHYGLLVKLKKNQRVPFRLFFSTDGQAGSIDNGVQP